MAAVLKRWFGARTSHDLGNVSRFVNAFGRKTWIPTATTTTVERRTALETTQALTLRKKNVTDRDVSARTSHLIPQILYLQSKYYRTIRLGSNPEGARRGFNDTQARF